MKTELGLLSRSGYYVTSWTAEESEIVSGGSKRFFSSPQIPHQLKGLPSLLYNGYWVLYSGRLVKTTKFHLASRLKTLELYSHSPGYRCSKFLKHALQLLPSAILELLVSDFGQEAGYTH
jgi:hypothetical protein